MIRFLFAVVAAAVLIWGTAEWLFTIRRITELPSFFYPILLFNAITAWGLYGILIRFGKPAIFTQVYLFTLVLKMLASCVFILTIIIQDPADAASNGLFFLMNYLIFTTLEVLFLYRVISRRHPF